MKQLRLGTRGSALAVWQSEYVARQLKKELPHLDVEINIIKTKGDKILDVALSKIGDKGLFTKEIENALLAGEVDLAVHSMKDLPSILAPDLVVGAVLKRENPQDVLVSHKGYTLATIPLYGSVGTSSLRRIAQLRAMRPDINTIDLRGNVDTRIRRMQEQDLDGIILAYAGVTRLNLADRISEMISTQSILPAVGQGAIAIEVREDDERIKEILELIDDRPSHMAIQAERAFLRQLEGGCQVPIAALAEIKNGLLQLEGLVASMDGREVIRETLSGPGDQAEEIGRNLAQELLNRGARIILEQIRV